MGGAPIERGRSPPSYDLPHYPVPLSCGQSGEAAGLQSVLALGAATRRGSSEQDARVSRNKPSRILGE